MTQCLPPTLYLDATQAAFIHLWVQMVNISFVIMAVYFQFTSYSLRPA